MYAIIKNRDGHEEARYALTDTDLLDCDLYAARYSADVGIDYQDSEWWHDLPDGCEDFSVTLTEDPANTAVCWKSKNYCVVCE
jgi:hypothetical protein